MFSAFELNCLIVDNPNLNDIFTVDIKKIQDVICLREAIKTKKKHALDHVDAYTLELWSVCFAMTVISSRKPSIPA